MYKNKPSALTDNLHSKLSGIGRNSYNNALKKIFIFTWYSKVIIILQKVVNQNKLICNN